MSANAAEQFKLRPAAQVVAAEDGTWRGSWPESCWRCESNKTVKHSLADLIRHAAVGTPWALAHAYVLVDQLQSQGNRWGYWLAALLSPRRWGGWWTHPARKEVESEIALVLAWEATRVRNDSNAIVCDPPYGLPSGAISWLTNRAMTASELAARINQDRDDVVARVEGNGITFSQTPSNNPRIQVIGGSANTRLGFGSTRQRSSKRPAQHIGPALGRKLGLRR